MGFMGIEEAKEKISTLEKGDHVAFQDKTGTTKIGTVRIKSIRCGKINCKKCPHQKYAYAQYRDGGKVTEKYIGKIS